MEYSEAYKHGRDDRIRRRPYIHAPHSYRCLHSICREVVSKDTGAIPEKGRREEGIRRAVFAPSAEDEHGGEAHNDVDVAWSYTCAKPGELKEVEVKLFSAFPEGFQHIKAEWVTEKGASAQALTQDASIQLN